MMNKVEDFHERSRQFHFHYVNKKHENIWNRLTTTENPNAQKDVHSKISMAPSHMLQTDELSALSRYRIDHGQNLMIRPALTLMKCRLIGVLMAGSNTSLL
jgi:hypothetical protein